MLGMLVLAAMPYALMVERMENPVGIDTERPRLSWKLPKGIARQCAYEIDADGWNSGRVKSGSFIDIPWGGPALVNSQRVSWRVRIWDEGGEPSEWSERSQFVMGMMTPDAWEAKWIGANPKSCPKTELGGEWLEGERFVKPFDRGDDYVCELAIASTRPFTVKLSGRVVYSTSGSLYDARRLRVFDLAQYSKSGTNLLEIAVFGTEEKKSLARLGDPGVPAIRAAVRDSKGVRFSSEPGWGGKPLACEIVDKLEATVDFREEIASPSFERRFKVRRGVQRATLHVTGLGFYEAFLNGKKIGGKVLDPAPTDYDKRVLYSTYLLDTSVLEGENALRIDLGHGWYDMRSIATWNFESAPWRDRPKAIARLELEYEDGGSEAVVTDESWSQVHSPTIFDCIREGEIQGREICAIKFPLAAVEVAAPKGALQSAAIPGAVVAKEYAPERIFADGDGRWIATFPESIAGWARCDFRGLKEGDEVAIRYDENLASDGGKCEPVKVPMKWFWRSGERLIDMFFQATSSGRRLRKGGADMQVDHFVSSGREVEHFEPRFVWHGFRHVIFEGLRKEPRPEDVRACLVHTDFAETGSFSCSDAQLTELVRMTLNSYRANFTTGFPTDCPHREKLGWTGDAWIASELGQLYFENTAAYEKWLRDVIDTQREDGSLCCIVPTSGWGYTWGNGPTFDAVVAMLPWNLWLFRGDRKALETAYPALVKYLAYEKSIETAPDLVSNGLDDWNARDSSHKPSAEYTISCVYLALREIASKAAEVLGFAEEARGFAAAAERTRAALRAKYYRGNGVYDNGGQTAQALAVVFGLSQQSERDVVAERLVESFEKTGFHADYGLLGSKFVYRALSEVGRGDVAYKTIVNPTEPTMTKWIGKNGTLWEDWNHGQSKCHIMLGDFSAWAMEYIAGIRRPMEPGYAKVLIEPTLAGTLIWAKGATMTPRGRISSEWRLEGGKFELKVEIPPACEAMVRLPNGTERAVSSGSHAFTLAL